MGTVGRFWNKFRYTARYISSHSSPATPFRPYLLFPTRMEDASTRGSPDKLKKNSVSHAGRCQSGSKTPFCSTDTIRGGLAQLFSAIAECGAELRNPTIQAERGILRGMSPAQKMKNDSHSPCTGNVPPQPYSCPSSGSTQHAVRRVGLPSSPGNCMFRRGFFFARPAGCLWLLARKIRLLTISRVKSTCRASASQFPLPGKLRCPTLAHWRSDRSLFWILSA